ncbi:MAG: flagellar hook-basal body complex protein [Planctomycetes bacterium]|nr:flagellar hook-basal body complex protein [Planctomycetota bacterium]
MSSALSAAVSGLKAHQTMLDVAGNNLANVNTTAYKSSSVTFAELLSQNIRGASGPAGNLGGTNPLQTGSGVEVSGIARNQTQGNIVSTGQDLDVAIDGEGFFVLSNGRQSVYTRAGSFATDADNTLVDPATGYKVLQLDNSPIQIPWGTAMPASATTEIVMNGNLRSSADSNQATYNKIISNAAFTTNSGANSANSSTLLSDLDQWGHGGSTGFESGKILISGIKEDGTTFENEEITWGPDARLGDILDQISALFNNSTATLDSSGHIVLTALDKGYNQANITGMSYVPGAGEMLSLPTYFNYSTVGGNDSKNFSITVFDSMGEQHVLTGVFVKTDTPNTWDLVITSVSGETEPSWDNYDIINDSSLNRRISGIEFNPDGSLKGLNSSAESTTFSVRFDNNPTPQEITLNLGTEGEFTGLTQFSGQSSTAGALTQDGYESGSLSSVNIDQNGTVIGMFTNGVKIDIAQLQLAVFSNANGLESVGNGYFLPTANSGDATVTIAGTNGAGTIRGQSLEESNVDMATEFVTLMQAQNGYQANARTIRVATDILRELTNLIR